MFPVLLNFRIYKGVIIRTIYGVTKFSFVRVTGSSVKQRVKIFIHTPLFNSKSVFATMHLYHTSHRALFTAKEANRFI